MKNYIVYICLISYLTAYQYLNALYVRTFRLNGVFTALKETWGGDAQNIDRNNYSVREWLFSATSKIFKWSLPLPVSGIAFNKHQLFV